MPASSRSISNLQNAFFRLPVFARVLIANSLVILLGAVYGTIITRHLSLVGNFLLILLFSTLGLALTLVVNYWVIKTVSRPFLQLRQAIERVQEGQTTLPETPLMHSDPDVHQMVETVNSMLARLDRRTRQLRALSERAIYAQEEERKRIARGLHDETAQSLSTLIIHLEQLENSLPDSLEDIRSRLAGERQLATRMLEDLRENIWDLRPAILDDLGLVPAIRWYARAHLEKHGIAPRFDELDESIRLPPHLETMLFRVVQEAVSNILRHSKASQVDLRLRQSGAHLCLEVKDDGQGFDVEQTAGEAVPRKQLGLLGIQERVTLVGGEVNITSTPGRGTCLVVCVPLNGSAAAQPVDSRVDNRV